MYRDPDNHISLEVGLGAGEPTGWGGGRAEWGGEEAEHTHAFPVYVQFTG